MTPTTSLDAHLGFATGLAYALAQCVPSHRDDQLRVTVPDNDSDAVFPGGFDPDLFGAAIDILNAECSIFIWRHRLTDGWHVIDLGTTEGHTLFTDWAPDA